MGLCIATGAALIVLSASSFTLSWTHSVEKTRWEESWRVTTSGLVLEEARIQSTGAGMDPPEDAVLRNGVWTYRPKLPPLPRLSLASSASTGAGWTLCSTEGCITLPEDPQRDIVLQTCPN